MKSSLGNQLEDMKRLAEGEARDKALLVGKFKGLEGELEKLRERIEEENSAKADIQRSLSRNVAESQIWKSKYSTEAVARIEDLENAKSKLVARINEAEECIEGLNLKVEDDIVMNMDLAISNIRNAIIEGLNLKVEDYFFL